MRSGKPVICYKLDGIPADYDPYLQYIPAPGAAGIRQAVEALRSLPVQHRNELGEAARRYVLTQKNPAAQCRKLVDWLRSL
jgi:glycosyltransferase involved in cell wall biosynthesis